MTYTLAHAHNGKQRPSRVGHRRSHPHPYDPYYAINVAPDLAVDHQPIISKIDWIKANRHLIDELGADKWLVYLLSILEGEYPRQPEDVAVLGGYSPDNE